LSTKGFVVVYFWSW